MNKSKLELILNSPADIKGLKQRLQLLKNKRKKTVRKNKVRKNRTQKLKKKR